MKILIAILAFAAPASAQGMGMHGAMGHGGGVGMHMAVVLYAVLAALGGQGNLRSVTARPGRVLVAVREAATVDIGALRAAGVRDAVVLHAGAVHLLVADAEELARRITPSGDDG